jgi:hypothetical protein
MRENPQKCGYVSIFLQDFTLERKIFVSRKMPKGAGNIEYGDIENREIEKTGTLKKKWGTKF